MNKRGLTSVLAALALAGAGLIGGTAALADDVTPNGDLIDYPLPGTLSFLGGVAGWVNTNYPAAVDPWRAANPGATNVYDPASVTPFQADHIETSIVGGIGHVEVLDSMCQDVTVGYVFADAVGALTVDIQGQLRSADQGAKLTLSGDDLWALLDGVVATVSGNFSITLPVIGTVTAAVSVTIDLGGPTVTSASVLGYSTQAQAVIDAINAFLPTVFSNPLAGLPLLDVPLADIFALVPPVAINQNVAVPFSFGLSFTDLTNGNWADIDPQAAVDASWLQYLDGNNWSGQVGLGDITLANGTAADYIADAVAGLLSNALASAQGNLAGALGGVLPAIEGLLGGLLNVNIPVGTTASLTFNQVTFAPGAGDVLAANLVDLVNSTASAWLPTILNNAQVDGSIATTFSAGSVQNLTLADVTFSAVTHSLGLLSTSSVALKVGDSADVSAEIAALLSRFGGLGTLQFDLTLADPTVASLGTPRTTRHQHGVTITGLAEGDTTLQVEATVTCGADTMSYTVPVNVSVSGRPTTPPPNTGPTPPPQSNPGPGNPIQQGQLPFTGGSSPVLWMVLCGLALTVAGAKMRRFGRINLAKHRA